MVIIVIQVLSHILHNLSLNCGFIEVQYLLFFFQVVVTSYLLLLLIVLFIKYLHLFLQFDFYLSFYQRVVLMNYVHHLEGSNLLDFQQKSSFYLKGFNEYLLLLGIFLNFDNNSSFFFGLLCLPFHLNLLLLLQ